MLGRVPTVSSPVLHVEDNPHDVFLFRELSGIPPESIVVAGDGSEALQYLFSALVTGREPSLIVLDLNLPKLDGRFILTVLKSTPGLQRIPVAVLTTSDSERDRQLCAAADAYYRKPAGLDESETVAKEIAQLWKQGNDAVTRRAMSVVASGRARGLPFESDWLQSVSYFARHDFEGLRRQATFYLELFVRRPEIEAQMTADGTGKFESWPDIRDTLGGFLRDFEHEMCPGSLLDTPPWNGCCDSDVLARINSLWITDFSLRAALDRTSAAIDATDDAWKRMDDHPRSTANLHEFLWCVITVGHAIDELPVRLILPQLGEPPVR
jgi:two-component system response regulator